MKSSYLLLLLLLTGCGSPSTPVGGPKDEAPPACLGAVPPNFSTHFTGQTIRIHFDEYIRLDNVRSQLITSPPLSRPEVKEKLKDLNILLSDSLVANTTYTFYFGDAIRDNNEGNILKDFRYIFSTGAAIDSLSIWGKAVDAYSHQPIKKGSALLLHQPSDIFNKELKPLFVSRLSEEGLFTLDYLREGCFFLAVLNEKDNNLVYDSLQEEVAFLSECIRPSYVYLPTYDSLVDSVPPPQPNVDSLRHTLLLFKQTLPQAVSQSEFISKHCLRISFRNAPVSPRFEIVQPLLAPRAVIRATKGTYCDLYLPEGEIQNAIVRVSDGLFVDTVKVLNTKISEASAKLSVQSSVSSELPYFDSLFLRFSCPVDSTAHTRFFFVVGGSDTSDIGYVLAPDGMSARLDHPFVADQNYEILVPGGSFYDLYRQSHDTLVMRFKTSIPEKYSSLELSFEKRPSGPLLLQLLNERFEVLRQLPLTSDRIRLPHLVAGKYRLRLIEDANNNGQWDGGNFREQRLPESVHLFPKVLDVKSNWELTEEWKF